MIEVTLNGEKTQVPENLSLAGLISHLKLPAERIAIEHNLEIVRRKNWPSIRVQPGDRIEVVHFVGGG
ncbi:MAG: sulfur carrier protein ThiS [Acidobacteriia bacterium]|nr:sulfur carrier protein ThiS [Terriglobia bacterium]